MNFLTFIMPLPGNHVKQSKILKYKIFIFLTTFLKFQMFSLDPRNIKLMPSELHFMTWFSIRMSFEYAIKKGLTLQANF